MCLLNQELLKPVAQTCWSEETCSQNVKLDDDEIEEVTNAVYCSTQHFYTNVEVGYNEPQFWGKESAPVYHGMQSICTLYFTVLFHHQRQRPMKEVLWR